MCHFNSYNTCHWPRFFISNSSIRPSSKFTLFLMTTRCDDDIIKIYHGESSDPIMCIKEGINTIFLEIS